MKKKISSVVNKISVKTSYYQETVVEKEIDYAID